MVASLKDFIRRRRESLGISQQRLAELLVVSKSLMSHIENGNRQPSIEQIKSLATILQVPIDLLAVSTGRLPEDVRGALESHNADIVAAIRQKTETTSVSYPTEPKVKPVTNKIKKVFNKEKIEEKLIVSKSSTEYRAHSYHTKVPPEAIRPFIRAYTNPGDTILDPFSGSGMTGVAALMEGRSALLSDLSPAAVHISKNYTAPCNAEELKKAFNRLEQDMKPTIDWLYRPVGSSSIVEYTTWSDIFSCPKCSTRLVYWELVKDELVSDKHVKCSNCLNSCTKNELTWVGEKAVQSHTSEGKNRINVHEMSQEELDLIEQANSYPIPYWIPDVEFNENREMWRASHRAMGINNISKFFTKRNLHALAALRHFIITNSEGRVREALMFAFTASVNRASKRYQWNKKRPTNVMTGTLYISSLRYEWNVWSLFKRKVADAIKFYTNFPDNDSKVQVFRRSAAELYCIPDSSVDMVFMDPPFGSNIFYADASILWDSWLGELTNTDEEMVINKKNTNSQNHKNIDKYLNLLYLSFSQAARVLKKGGRAILVFSNSDDKVWQGVQKALISAGLETESVHTLFKGQPSIKGIKGIQGVENVTNLDLILCLKHSEEGKKLNEEIKNEIWRVIDETILHELRNGSYRNDEIYSSVIRKIIQENISVEGITMPKIADRCKFLGAQFIESKWFIKPCDNLKNTDDFIDYYISKKEDLPKSKRVNVIKNAITLTSVKGGRNSPFYNAHSYHTKVPPESITPFIEHYSNQGDIVLDPFCGSGMTGVAAAMSGRRAILNDLSPAAIHLSWNHTHKCSSHELTEAFENIESKIKSKISDLYETTGLDGKKGQIFWTLWSIKHECLKCNNEFLLWDIVERNDGKLGKEISCPHCNTLLKRSELKNLGSYPALIYFEDSDGKRHEKRPLDSDLNNAFSVKKEQIKEWYPKVPIDSNREMYIRCALQKQGIKTISDFYTPRNLQALAIIWNAINEIEDERIKRVLAFAFTNTAWHGTKMRRYNARGGQRPLTGTLYIPQLSSEANVLEVMRNKIKQLARYYSSYLPKSSEMPKILLGSATNLESICTDSVDYIFTDPPFGSNIFYSDCNLIWESWLGRITDSENEAVMNKSLKESAGGKSLEDYSLLMSLSMKEMARVLKPGGWATIVFHSSEAKVWNAIRDAAVSAGFEFHEATSLDRLQQSHKGYKGRSEIENVAHFDVVFNLRKPLLNTDSKSKLSDLQSVDLEELIASLIRDPVLKDKGLQGIHSEIMRRVASDSNKDFFDYTKIRKIWERLK